MKLTHFILFISIPFLIIIFIYINVLTASSVYNSNPNPNPNQNIKDGNYEEFDKLEKDMKNRILEGQLKIRQCLGKSETKDHKECYIGKGVKDEYMMEKPYKLEDITIEYPIKERTIIDSPDFCDDKPDVIFVYYTGVNQFIHRYSIRKTIGQINYYNGRSIKVLFFLGSTTDTKAQNLMILERNKYRDIVQFSPPDNYLKITTTRILSYEWLINHCKHKYFYIKSDVDLYTNFFDIIDYELPHIESKYQNTPVGAGYIIRNSNVIRSPYHKNAIFKELFPEEVYPPYPSGCFSIWTSSTISLVYFFII